MILLSVSFATVMQWIGYILVALLCLMVMIVIHEFGHYVAGKLFHFKINEFSIGFGPALLHKQNKKTGEYFSIRAVPLGGFCAFAGEDSEETAEGDFNSKPVWQRIIVLFAGAFFNYLSALIVISIFFMSYGDFHPLVVDTYAFNDSAYVQQLQEGDVITAVNGKDTYSLLEANKLQQLLAGHETVTLTVVRNGETIELEVAKAEYTHTYVDENGVEQTTQGYGLGIGIGYEKVKLPFFRAIGHGFEFGFDLVRVTFRAIGDLFTGKAYVGDTMGGTVTAIQSLVLLTKEGFAAIIYGFCVLSMSIALFNLLPIPALDGSRIVFAIIEGIRRKPLNRKVEGMIHAVGLFALLGLAIVLDLLHFLG